MRYLLLPILLLAACTPARQLANGTGELINGSISQSFPGGRMECNDGPICADLELIRVVRSKKSTSVKLRNRTGDARAVQVSFEELTAGVPTDTTRYFDVAMSPHSASTFELPGFVTADDAELVVHVRGRRAL